ncbi:MAG: ATP-binding protein [bacterium]
MKYDKYEKYETQDQIMHREVMNEYERLQKIASNKLKERKEICYKKCPRIKEIDNELNKTGIKITKLIIIADKEDKLKYLEKIKMSTQNLNKEKSYLLKLNGFNENYFEDIYYCKKCKDKGYIDNQKCECFGQKVINKYYEEYDILKVLKKSRLSDFNIEYYSKVNLEKYNSEKSPYECMRDIIYPRVMRLINSFGQEPQNILFSGTEGLGKTFLCRCIGNVLLSKGHSVIYITAYKVFELHEKRKFSKPLSEMESRILNMILHVELLIIDDLGTEFTTTPSLTEFFNIINTRFESNKSTIISTNLEPIQISENYSSRVFSRVFGNYEVYTFIGEDIRFIKNKKIK